MKKINIKREVDPKYRKSQMIPYIQTSPVEFALSPALSAAKWIQRYILVIQSKQQSTNMYDNEIIASDEENNWRSGGGSMVSSNSIYLRWLLPL